jgi:hypothetical protein
MNRTSINNIKTDIKKIRKMEKITFYDVVLIFAVMLQFGERN